MKINKRVLMIATMLLPLLLFLSVLPSGKAMHQSCSAEGIEEVREVEVDIEPGFCPNPLDMESHGVLTAAILGTEDLDVTSIDPKSVRLEGITPVQYKKNDISTPVTDRLDVCDCTIEGKDGINDLVLSFDIRKIISTLGDVGDDDVAVLTITARLFNGTPIEGEDCVVIRKTSPEYEE